MFNYFILLFNFLKDIKHDRLTLLAIFAPIFILYPIAEIEVLARKEIIVFSLYITYLFIPKIKYFKKLFILFNISCFGMGARCFLSTFNFFN